MISLLASIVGFFSSIMPEIIKLFKDKGDKKHELDILDRQIEFNRISHNKMLEEIHVSRDILEQNSLYSTFHANNKVVDALNSSVRPVLAYCFFGVYIFVKYLQYLAISATDATFIEYLDIIWNIDDQAIFSGIISFYFGQQTFKKFWNNR